jgi:hypothetical protein
MLKKIVIVSAAVLLTACSTLGGKKDEPKVNTDFMGGNIRVSYTLTGEFESLTSSGVAKVTSTLPSAVDEAYLVATLQARKQIVEFMKVEVENSNFIRAVAESLQEGVNTNGSPDNKVTSKIATELQDNIRQQSKAILVGTYVADKSYDAGSRTVKVVIRTSIKDNDTAKQVSRMMGN